MRKSVLVSSILFLLKMFYTSFSLSVPIKIGKSGFPKFPVENIACGRRLLHWRPDREPRVVGGEESPFGAVPWQVTIRYRGKHRCGGVLVSKRLVLTAAHCYIENITVVAGTHDHHDDYDYHGHDSVPHKQHVKVEKGLVHPDFKKLGPHSHDIAVLLLENPGVKLNDNVKPACLTHETPPPGTWCEISGWGSMDPRSPGRPSPVLRSAAVPILSLDTCRKKGVYGGRYQPILDSMLCAGHLKGGIDACGGDSGSPLVCEIHGRFQLVGLVSWGEGCAKKGRPGVYTNVASFLSWIRSTAIDFNVDYDI